MFVKASRVWAGFHDKFSFLLSKNLLKKLAKNNIIYNAEIILHMPMVNTAPDRHGNFNSKGTCGIEIRR